MTVEGHVIVRLSDLINQFTNEEGNVDELALREILSDFSCSMNKDVNNFLHDKAILFNMQGIAKTHLVMASYKGSLVIVGYFALATKTFVIKCNKIPKRLKSRILKFGQYNPDLDQLTISAPLIGQLGKNDKYSSLIDGNTLLEYACSEVKKVQMIVGGKVVYLECEEKQKLLDFYGANKFVNFGSRQLEADEKDSLSGIKLIQLLRYLS